MNVFNLLCSILFASMIIKKGFLICYHACYRTARLSGVLDSSNSCGSAPDVPPVCSAVYNFDCSSCT